MAGSLARRHGITLVLHNTPCSGVTAAVEIPTSLLAGSALPTPDGAHAPALPPCHPCPSRRPGPGRDPGSCPRSGGHRGGRGSGGRRCRGRHPDAPGRSPRPGRRPCGAGDLSPVHRGCRRTCPRPNRADDLPQPLSRPQPLRWAMARSRWVRLPPRHPRPRPRWGPSRPSGPLRPLPPMGGKGRARAGRMVGGGVVPVTLQWSTWRPAGPTGTTPARRRRWRGGCRGRSRRGPICTGCAVPRPPVVCRGAGAGARRRVPAAQPVCGRPGARRHEPRTEAAPAQTSRSDLPRGGAGFDGLVRRRRRRSGVGLSDRRA